MKGLSFIRWCLVAMSFLTTSHCLASQLSYALLSLRKDIADPHAVRPIEIRHVN
jgi:hypothetical protein